MARSRRHRAADARFRLPKFMHFGSNPSHGGTKTIALLGAVGLGGFGGYLAGKDGALPAALQTPLHQKWPAIFPAAGTKATDTPAQRAAAQAKAAAAATAAAKAGQQKAGGAAAAGQQNAWQKFLGGGPTAAQQQAAAQARAAAAATPKAGAWAADVDLVGYGAPGYGWNPNTHQIFAANSGMPPMSDTANTARDAANAVNSMLAYLAGAGASGTSDIDLGRDGAPGFGWNPQSHQVFDATYGTAYTTASSEAEAALWAKNYLVQLFGGSSSSAASSGYSGSYDLAQYDPAAAGYYWDSSNNAIGNFDGSWVDIGPASNPWNAVADLRSVGLI